MNREIEAKDSSPQIIDKMINCPSCQTSLRMIHGSDEATQMGDDLLFFDSCPKCGKGFTVQYSTIFQTASVF